MIWTLANDDVTFAISDGVSRLYQVASRLNVNLRQSTQVELPSRGEWPVAFPGRASRTLSFDIPVTFPPCDSHEMAEMQAHDIPLQCPRGGVLTGLSGASLRTYSQAWIDDIRADNQGVRNLFTFRVSAVNPTATTLSLLAQMDRRYKGNLYAITRLTGEDATDLDGITTTDVAVGFQCEVFVPVGGLNQLCTFRLIAGTDVTNTDPEAGPIIVRPTDFDADDNPKVWMRLDA